MPHNPQKRREATAIPLVLFGERGRTVEGYRPADEDLATASPAPSHKTGSAVSGPHLLAVRRRHARNKTGVVGVSLEYERAREQHFYVVNLGSGHRRFCIETLGRTEAFRRAVALRHEHERKITLANAVILAAREDNGGRAQ